MKKTKINVNCIAQRSRPSASHGKGDHEFHINIDELFGRYITPENHVKNPVLYPHQSIQNSTVRNSFLEEPSILVVGDDDASRFRITQTLLKIGIHAAGCSIATCFDLYRFDEGNAMIVWLDLSGDAAAGDSDLLIRMKKHFAGAPTIVFDDSERNRFEKEIISSFALTCLKSLNDTDLIFFLIRNVMRLKQVQIENAMIKQSLSFPHNNVKTVGKSDVTRKLSEAVELASTLETPVVLQGENGSKKHFIAQKIHLAGVRARYPFDILSLDTFPRECFPLYFYGCISDRHPLFPNGLFGKLNLMHQGTIFIDQINRLHLPQQKQLVGFLKNKTFSHYGSDQTTYANVRIIAASHVDLWQEVKLGTFNEELYNLLHATVIRVPSFRELKEDIPEIFQLTVSWIAALNDLPVPAIAPSVIDKLVAYTWPGNTVEFENIVARAVLGDRDGVIRDDDIHFDEHDGIHKPDAGQKLGLAGMSMGDIQKKAILETLEYCNGNKSQAAKMLCISEKTLYNKLNSFELD